MVFCLLSDLIRAIFNRGMYDVNIDIAQDIKRIIEQNNEYKQQIENLEKTLSMILLELIKQGQNITNKENQNAK